MSAETRYTRFGECKRCGFCCLGGDKNEPCEHLVWGIDGAICMIYDSKPVACDTFPDAPPILTDKCGYYFIDLWENKRLGVKEV